MKIIYAFLVALPELLRLIKNLQKRIDEAKTDKKVKEDLTKINKAFEDNDEKALNDIFNS